MYFRRFKVKQKKGEMWKRPRRSNDIVLIHYISHLPSFQKMSRFNCDFMVLFLAIVFGCCGIFQLNASAQASGDIRQGFPENEITDEPFNRNCSNNESIPCVVTGMNCVFFDVLWGQIIFSKFFLQEFFSARNFSF